jgi:hypothetical protein
MGIYFNLPGMFKSDPLNIHQIQEENSFLKPFSFGLTHSFLAYYV